MPSPDLLKILQKSESLNMSIDFMEIHSRNIYRRIYSLILGFEGKEDFEFYALINRDREHAISWLSVENEKKGHINQENLLVLVIQVADWFALSLESKNLSEMEVISAIKQELFSLLPILKEKKCQIEDLTKWKNALPVNKLDQNLIEDLKKKSIFVIGDSLVGKGRVDGAMKTGIDLHKELSTF